MTRSVKTTPKKTTATTKAPDKNPVESVAVPQQPKQTKPRRKAIAPARRIAVQYTPRIPGAHCPGC